MNKSNPVQKPDPKPVEVNLGKPNPFATGRRVIWTIAQIKSLYTDKPDDTIKAAFGAPDQKLGDTWVYHNMIIIDPLIRRRLNTAMFLIKDGKVLSVEAN